MALGALNLIHHCAAYLSTPDLVPSEGLANSNLLTRSSSAASDSPSALYTPSPSNHTGGGARSLSSPLKSKSSKISEQALADSLAQHSSSYIESVSKVLPSSEVQTYPLLPLWWCILAGLSSLISDDRLTVSIIIIYIYTYNIHFTYSCCPCLVLFSFYFSSFVCLFNLIFH
jgi:hypothetical protein